MPDSLDRLALRVFRLEQNYRRSNQSQLAFSSLEDGSIDEYDGDGNLVGIIGKQWDGTHGHVVVSGPPPPQPSAPVCTPGPGLATLAWDGSFADGGGVTDITIPAPMDLSRVEIHVSREQGFQAVSAATLVSTIESPRGGQHTTMLEPGLWCCVLVARSASGKASQQSAEVAFTVLEPVGSDVDVEELRREFQEADAEAVRRIEENRAAQEALAGTVRALQGETLPALDAGLAAARRRLDEADVLLTDTFPKRITAAESAAGGAASAAAAVKTAADKAAASAAAAVGQADTALDRADSALTMAGSKSRLYYSTANASGSAAAGDTWRKVNAAGDVVAEWRSTGGTSWVPQKVTSDMVSHLDVGKLTVGTAALATAVAEKFAAATADFQRANVANLFVTGETKLQDAVARHIAAESGKYVELAVGQLTAGAANLDDAVANKLYAGIFASNKIYGNQIVLGHPGNVMPDPMHMDATMLKRRNSASTCTVTKRGADLELNNASTGNQYFRPLGVPQTPAGVLDGGWIPVQPGEVWEWGLSLVGAKDVGGWLKFVGRTKDGSAYANPSGQANVPVGSGDYFVRATIPPNCYWICPEMLVRPGVCLVTAGTMFLRQKITPALIVDGLIDGQRVIGASIETQSAANRGIKLNDGGLWAWDTKGNQTFRLDTQGGLSMKGDLTVEGINVEGSVTYPARALLSFLPAGGYKPNVGAPALYFQSTDPATGQWDYNMDPARIVSSENAWGIGMISALKDVRTDGQGKFIATPSGTRIEYWEPKTWQSQVHMEMSPRFWELRYNSTLASVNSNRLTGWGGRITADAADVVELKAPRIDLAGAVSQTHQHAELNLQTTLASSNYEAGLGGTFALDSAASNLAGFVTGTTNGTIILAPGVYTLAAFIDAGAPMGDAPAASLRNVADGSTVIASGFTPGRWNITLTYPALRVTVGTRFRLWVGQNSGTTRTIRVRLNIEKIK